MSHIDPIIADLRCLLSCSHEVVAEAMGQAVSLKVAREAITDHVAHDVARHLVRSDLADWQHVIHADGGEKFRCEVFAMNRATLTKALEEAFAIGVAAARQLREGVRP